MMDGQVMHIRSRVYGNGFSDVAILSYSAKHASAVYLPFRDASSSSPRSGDSTGWINSHSTIGGKQFEKLN